MRKFKIIFLITLVAGYALAGPKDKPKDELKKAFKNLSVPSRLQAIRDAETMHESPLKEQTSENEINLVDYLSKYCGDAYKYTKQGDGYLWPKIECEYTPDDKSFGGSTEKMNCLFKDESKKDRTKKYKVKYAEPNTPYGKAEIAPTFLASLTAHLMGFYTELYCPATLVCKNCPSGNPWKNERASAPAGNGVEIIQRALIEIPLNAMNIRNPGPDQNYNQGFDFNELVYLSADSQVRRQQMIEREAWLLWMNFLMDFDAFNFNQRISCLKGHLKDDEAICERSVVYSHDYGYAFFKKLQLQKWDQNPAIIQKPDGSCIGGLSEEIFKLERSRQAKGLLLSPEISLEAKNLFISRIYLITDQQWKTMYELINADEVSSFTNKVSKKQFLKIIKNKIAEIGKTNCQSIDLGRSALSNPTPK